MTNFDLTNAPDAFFKNGTFQRGSEVYKWYWNMMGFPDQITDPDITKETISTKWGSKEIIWQQFTEFADGKRVAWQQVWVGSFGPAGRKMNGKSATDYQAYYGWMTPPGFILIPEDPSYRVEDPQYQSTGGATITIKNGVLIGEMTPFTPTIPADIWSKYFASFFSFDNPVSVNGVQVLNFSNEGSSQVPTTDALIGTSKKADVLIFDRTPSFGAATADRIINFNPKDKDKIQIALGQFGSNISRKFGIAKNTKNLSRILASSTDFAYLRSTGEIYFNENGAASGFGNGGVFAVLEGRPNLSPSNIEFF